MKQSVFDVVENFIGVELNQKNLKRLSKLSNKEAIELHDRIKLFYRFNYYFVDSEELPKISQDEVRYAFLTDSYGEMDSYEIWNEPKAEYLKKLLLYYPSVAVLDPVDELLSLCAEYPPTFENAFSPLLPLRHLIEKDIVRLVPGMTGKSTVIEQIDLTSHFLDVLADDRIFEAIREYEKENYDLIVNLNLELMGAILNQSERAAVDSLVRKGFSSGLLIWAAIIIKELHVKFLMADLTDSNMGSVCERDMRFYRALMAVNSKDFPRLGELSDVTPSILLLTLPNIKNVSMADILAIRENDEDFYFWREAFRDVMKKSYSLDNLSNPKFFVNAKEILSSRSRSLRESVKGKSSIKDKAQDAGITAGIGFTVGILTSDLATALGGSMMTGGMTLLASLFVKKPSKAEKALCRHFSAFLDK